MQSRISARFFVRRFLSLIVSLWLVSLLAFVIIHVVPGDPAMLVLGHEASPEALDNLRAALGLNRPLTVQYLTWLAGALHGDLGSSLRYSQPVSLLIAQRLPVTLSLAALAMLLAVAVALPLGTWAAYREGTPIDYALLVLSQAGAAVPAFWIGLLLILLLAVQWRLFPTGGFVPWHTSPPAALRSLALPAAALSLPLTAVLLRLTRSTVLEELAKDHIRTARAKGLRPAAVLVRHALRAALVPIVTLVGLQLGFLLGGSIVIEQVFALPGLGRLTVFAIFNRDVPLAQGVIMFVAALVVGVNFVVDLAYALLDPRIALE